MFQPWIEQYRPKTLGDIVGHEEIVKRLKSYVESKNMPHLLFSGRAGIGKTCAALALANELYGDSVNKSFLELNASDERGIDVMRSKSQQTKGNVTSVKDFARTLSLGEVSFKIVFLDEADALTSDAQQALRRTMEKYSNNTRFILSCNYSSRIIEPIQSRCAVFRFTALTNEDLKKIIKRVADGESITVTEDGEKALLYVSTGDARKAINCLQAIAGLNKTVNEEEVFKVASRARPREVTGMIQNALSGEFMKARKDLQELMIKYGMNGEDVINQVYQEVTRLEMPDELKVNLIDKIGEYDYRLVEGANERIQLEALLAQIMLTGKKAK